MEDHQFDGEDGHGGFNDGYDVHSGGSDSDSDDDLSPSTLEAATAAKASIEKYYKNMFVSIREREMRRVRYEQKMEQIGLDEAEKEARRKKLDTIETQFLRARRIRLNKETFKTISIIGRGSFGEVRLVQMKGTKKLFAMKKLKKSKMIERNQVEHVKKERDALAELNDFYKQNAWVVRLYYSFQDALHLYLIMEYVPGGDLMTQLMRVEKFSEDWTRFYIAEIVLAVDSIHRFSYIHRDIKPDNILLDRKGHIKLSDFGLCTYLTTDDRVREMQSKYQSYASGEGGSSSAQLTDTSTSEKMDKFASWKKKRRELAFSEVGTPDYMAPEVLNPDGNGYGMECDWWSVGVIMFEMLAGFPVFYSSSESGSAATYRKIINWRETLEEALDEVSMSEEARDLVRRFLCERTVRIGAHGGLEEIQAHPFFDGFDWDRVRDGPAPLVPHIAHATDTSNFPMEDMDGEQFGAEEVEDAEIEERYPLYRGRRLRQTDIPFIGFTYKNLAAVPQLIRSPSKKK